MRKEIKFRKEKIWFGIFFYAILLSIFISFILIAEIYVRNIFMTEKSIKVIGIIGVIYSSSVLYSFIRLVSRKYSIQITDDSLIDNSKYESLGEIKWKDISKIQRFKKNNIELILNKTVFETGKRNYLQRFLTFMHNWNYKKSTLISSALIDCSIEELFETVSVAYEKNKLK
jgi:hypothetical protein